ncbi:MAG: ABC transporter ATP-binding protein [bacterium]|nr:ABC transporter ATP-binding protein [Candidatus Sumerlaeota bacterium]
MIRVENLTKEFGEIKAVDGLSFEVNEGEILGFLGPNGAGKTTTMRILTCFFPPTAGRASIAGFDVLTDSHEVRRRIGYMPEGVPLYRELTVISALDFIAQAKGFKRAQRAKYIDMAIDETGLGGMRNRIVGHLSKGYRQRMGLAQAILGEPKVLILDEPTVGLDPRQISEVRAMIRGMAGRRTVILSTHILPEVQMTCSRVLIINNGRIAASGTTEKLTTQMRSGSRSAALIAGPPASVLAALRSIERIISVEAKHDGVKSVSQQSTSFDVTEYMIRTTGSAAEIHPRIAEVIVGQGWKLIELRHVGLSLEEIFLKIVAGEPPQNGAADSGQEEAGNVA